MNKCIFVGNMVADPELRYTQSGIANCSFRIGVQRNFKNAQGSYDADFIQCVAWRASAEFVCNYLHKGDKVAVCGALQNRSYEAQDGSKRWVTEIIVEQIQGCGKAQQKGAQPAQNEFTEIPQNEYDDLPWA